VVFVCQFRDFETKEVFETGVGSINVRTNERKNLQSLDGGKLKLIVVTRAYQRAREAGVGVATSELTHELTKLGVELVAVIRSDASVRSRVNNAYDPTPTLSIEIKDNSFLKPFEKYLLSRRAVEPLKLLQKDYGEDCVIHSHSLFPSAFLGNVYKEMNVIFVTTIHGTYEGERERFKKETPVHPLELRYRLSSYMEGYVLRILKRRCKSHVIALSFENASRLMHTGLPKSRVHIIPNGVNLNFFKPYDRDEARKKLNLPTDKLIVLTIGYIEPRKGLHTLIKAARTVINEEPDGYFLIVGRVRNHYKWYMTYLEKLLSKLGLNKHFKFVGFVPTEEIPLYISAADIFALTSYAEGAPLVIPQAMACRRIVIATQGAAAEYLPPNLVVQNGNSDEIAQKISFYLSNTKERRLNSKELYKKAKNELSWANIARKTFDLYRKI
jgi:glycosyltransferase involved in cell wall biosynthesis